MTTDARQAAYDLYVSLLATGTQAEREAALKEVERLSLEETMKQIRELQS